MKMMKILMLGAAVAVIGSGVMTQRAGAASSNLDVDAQILAAVTVNCATDLSFGRLAFGSAQVVTVQTDGLRNSTVPAALLPGGAEDNGECAITGTDGYDIAISAADGVIDNGAGVDLEVSNFTFDDGLNGAAAGPYTFQTAAGAASIAIGADLNVTATDPAGSYTGAIVVTADYQ